VHADASAVVALGYGQAIPAPPDAPAGVPLAILSAPDELVAIGEREGERIRPRKVLA
jgi:hypothetical protein